MLASAESKEQVLQALREDVFHTAGVWDWDKVQVHPVRLSLAQAARTDVTTVQDRDPKTFMINDAAIYKETYWVEQFPICHVCAW